MQRSALVVAYLACLLVGFVPLLAAGVARRLVVLIGLLILCLLLVWTLWVLLVLLLIGILLLLLVLRLLCHGLLSWLVQTQGVCQFIGSPPMVSARQRIPTAG